jgi:hypothetical protein
MGSQVQTWGRRLALALIIVLVLVAVFIVAKRIIHGDKFTLQDTVAMRSTVDGMPYRVHPQHKDPLAAANRLATLNERLIALMRHLKHKYGPNATDPTWRQAYPNRARAVDQLLARYNPDSLAENSPLDPSGDSAYSLDKGALVAICLRERDPKLKACLKNGCPGVDPGKMALQDLDLLTFVAIHEQAHISITDVDHPPRFWSAFKFLLAEAAECGVLSPENTNFAQNSQTYCGMAVDYNPLYDVRTPIMS